MTDNPIGQFSISMTFGMHSRAITLLQGIYDEVEMYEKHPDEVKPEDVLKRIERLLQRDDEDV